MDHKRFAALTMEFLKKANMLGDEVQAYSEVWNQLNEIGAGALVIVTKADFTQSQKDQAELKKLKGKGKV